MTIFKSFIGAKDMKLWDGRTRTFDRLTSTGGTLTQNKIGHFVDALEVYGDGTAYTDSTIAQACSLTTDGVVMLQPATWEITGNLTIPATTELYVPKGAYINIAAGKTLTINGPFSAGLYQVFTGSGAVTFGYNAVEKVSPHWWGLQHTGVAATNRTAIQNAIDSIYDPFGGTQKACVSIPSGTFDIDGISIIMRQGVRVKGAGIYKTVLRSAGATNDVFTATGVSVWELENFEVTFTVTRTTGSIINISGASNTWAVRHIRGSSPYYGVLVQDGPNIGYLDDIHLLPGGSGGAINIGFFFRSATTIFVNDCNANYGNYTTNTGGFYIDSGCDGLFFTRCGVGANGGTGGMTGAYITHSLGGGSFAPRWLIFDNCWMEGGNGSTWGNAKPGYQIVNGTHVQITNSHGVSGQFGVVIQGGEGISVIGGAYLNNGQHGISIDGGTNIQIETSHIHNNSGQTANTYSGIHVSPNVGYFGIIDNQIGSSAVYGTQRTHAYDIVIDNGISDYYRILGNFCKDGASGKLYDGGSGAHKVVTNNLN